MLPGDDASLTLFKPSSRTVPFVLAGLMSEDHQRLFVAPEHEGGVLLQKPFYADFIGSGAIIDERVDAGYQAMYPIGKIHLSVATTPEEWRKARQKRIAYSCRLAEIARLRDSHRRAIGIIQQMCAWVGEDNAQLIPPDLIARLVGVHPKTISMAWLQRTEHCQFKFLEPDRSIDKPK